MRILGDIFDVDGTLLNSMSIWDTIGADCLRSIGYGTRENLNEVFKNIRVCIRRPAAARQNMVWRSVSNEIMAGDFKRQMRALSFAAL